MAVTEALMSLYLKEVVASKRLADVVHIMRKSTGEEVAQEEEDEQDPEDVLVAWADACCKILKHKTSKQQLNKVKL